MSDIRIDYAVVSQAQENINQGSRSIGSTMENMENSLRPLVEQWTGEASDAYHKAKANWDSALNGMNQVLQQIRGLLGESATDFHSSDRAGAARFGG